MNATAVEESKVQRLPERKDVDQTDTWDLSKLFATDDEWESSFKELEGMVGGYEQFRGTLADSAAPVSYTHLTLPTKA